MLAATLALLLIPQAVAAECAWVLWVQEERPISSRERWDLLKAFPDHKACSEELAVWLKKNIEAYRAIVGPKELGGINRVVIFENGVTRFDHPGGMGIVIERFYCLPDTIDPREKKE